MIRVNIDEAFPIAVTLLDENTGQVSSGNVVYYDIRKQPGDLYLSPAISGTLSESSVELGIYTATVSISEAGSYLVYATCSGFLPNTEEIIVNEENIYDLVKQNRHYNISVEDVLRITDTPTASQTARNVPKGKTDYVIARIKCDDDVDWSGENVVESYVYAWYRTTSDYAPYRMGDDGL